VFGGACGGVQGTRSSRGGTRDPGEPVGPLPANASVEEQIERLHKQLDGMHAVKKPILGSYEVLSHSNRRQGGMLHTLRVLRFSLSSCGCPVGATMCLKMLILPGCLVQCLCYHSVAAAVLQTVRQCLCARHF
jgi:hypothetical protein